MRNCIGHIVFIVTVVKMLRDDLVCAYFKNIISVVLRALDLLFTVSTAYGIMNWSKTNLVVLEAICHKLDIMKTWVVLCF